MQRLSLIAFLCLVSPLAMSAQLKGAVYSPSPGIVCDKKAQFCADQQGISLAYTKEYLGQTAEDTPLAAVFMFFIRDVAGMVRRSKALAVCFCF